MAKEVLEEKVTVSTLIWVAVVSVFLGFFGKVWLYPLPSSLAPFYNFGEVICTIGLTSAPFIVLMITVAFLELIRRRINVVILTYLYVVAFAISWFVSYEGMYLWGVIIGSRHMAVDLSLKYVPWILAPSADVTRQLIYGHTTIPWDAWLPSTIYYWIFFVSVCLFQISIATLFRRQWIDVEKLTFPHTMLAYELVKRSSKEESSIVKKLGKPFLLGTILGLVFQVPVFMTTIFPWFPDIYGWKTLCGPGYWYVRPGTSLAYVAGLTTCNVHPIAAVIGYILPLSITFNVWFWYIIWLILMQVSYAMGYYTGIENNGGCGRTGWCSPSGVIDPPLSMQSVTYGGGLLALTFAWLVLNRKYLFDTLKMTFKKSENRLEIEKNEALSYRDTYLLLGGSIILLITLFITVGMSATSILLMIITYFIGFVAYARIYGMTGLVVGGVIHGNTLFRLLMYPTAPDPLTTDFVMSAVYSLQGLDDAHVIHSVYTGFASYKMASLTGVSNKNVLKVMLIATVIAPIVVILTIISLLYTYGATALPGAGALPLNWDAIFANYASPASWITRPSREPVLPYVATGFLVTLLLEYLHARFIWLPLSGVGFVIGMSRINIKWGWWGPFLVAWILKTITLRIGGSKLYEEVGLPISAGFVVGYMIALILGGMMGLLRFFIPY
ncbi:MAG: OPT/YSL family transporter [Thermoproteota archaeon]